MHRRHIFVVLALVLAGAAGIAQEEQAQQTQPRGPVVGRSMVATQFGIVAASQPLAARAGVQILERGGNAIDAAIAANAVMGLVEPHGNGIGGDLFAIYYEAKTGKLHGLNAERLGADRPHASTLLKSKGITRDAAARHLLGDRAGRRGRLGRAARDASARCRCRDLLAPAIYYADDGFPVTEVIAAQLGGLGEEARRAIRTRARRICPTAARRRPARSSRTPISPGRCA